jgi:magnesium-transporting ATPase (P-type)
MRGVHHSAYIYIIASQWLTHLDSVFEYTYLLWWNAFFTIAPVIAIGVFDRLVGTFFLFSASPSEF